ncbi:uncharacterized protein MKZ38_003546 [Zalerion maritima]|uniref:S-adenosyl-L-methionine-dependent methyltransferase n=1 Tax=Zalerion maritima TaxID=339359 RepID=A0AAD5RNV4_9PEZI|nr:uncharacterized protein MKZ38_003546 [Zalerion maritima]
MIFHDLLKFVVVASVGTIVAVEVYPPLRQEHISPHLLPARKSDNDKQGADGVVAQLAGDSVNLPEDFGAKVVTDFNYIVDGQSAGTARIVEYNCNMHPMAERDAILEGVARMHKLEKDGKGPCGTNEHGPGFCYQYSCSWDSGIYICNDRKNKGVAIPCGLIGDIASWLTTRCEMWSGRNDKKGAYQKKQTDIVGLKVLFSRGPGQVSLHSCRDNIHGRSFVIKGMAAWPSTPRIGSLTTPFLPSRLTGLSSEVPRGDNVKQFATDDECKITIPEAEIADPAHRCRRCWTGWSGEELEQRGRKYERKILTVAWLQDPEFEGGDTDSSLGDNESNITSTASISSTILEYRKLHGRTYQNFKDAEYWGPNDETQNEGLDIAHHMMYLANNNKLFLAPLEDPQKVLDVGTGTGIWAIDFADEFPSAEVIGTDLSPIQPSWVPPNCKFELDNCEQEWTYPDNSLDYIHIRGLVGCVQDWPRLYAQCLRCLKPGGWIEQQEFQLPIASYDGTLPDDCVWHAWGKVFYEAGGKTARTFEVTKSWEKWLKEAGFPGPIAEEEVALPIGAWAKEKRWKDVGAFNRLSLEQGLEGFAMFLCTQVLGWKPEEVAVLCAQVRQALKDKSLHAYYVMKTVYTQKPAKG